jgi:hypothetical protein
MRNRLAEDTRIKRAREQWWFTHAALSPTRVTPSPDGHSGALYSHPTNNATVTEATFLTSFHPLVIHTTT